MECQELLAALNDYVDGERESSLCRALGTHLTECGPCRIVVENVRQTIGLYRSTDVEPPADLHEKLCQSLRGPWKRQFSLAKLPRNTLQRRVILEELSKVTSHPTAGQVRQLVKFRLPRINPQTVGRNLDRLAQLGRIQKLETPGFEPRFDANTEPHDHIRCLSCGRLDDLDRIEPDRYQWDRAKFLRFAAPGRGVEYNGTCVECQAATG